MEGMTPEVWNTPNCNPTTLVPTPVPAKKISAAEIVRKACQVFSKRKGKKANYAPTPTLECLLEEKEREADTPIQGLFVHESRDEIIATGEPEETNKNNSQAGSDLGLRLNEDVKGKKAMQPRKQRESRSTKKDRKQGEPVISCLAEGKAHDLEKSRQGTGKSPRRRRNKQDKSSRIVDGALREITHHNKPLYITGTMNGIKVNRILVDSGSAVNILPLETMRYLSLDINALTPDQSTIYGFNSQSQRALVIITLKFRFGELETWAALYVMDISTSYRVLWADPGYICIYWYLLPYTSV